MRTTTLRSKNPGPCSRWVNVPTVTWSNSDLYRLAAGQPARVNGLTVAPDGAVFASGRAADAAGVDHWMVRRLSP